MKAPSIFLGAVVAASLAQNGIAQQSGSGTLSTPAYNGTGADTSRGTSRFGTTGTGVTRTNMNFGTTLTQPAGTFGTNAGPTSGSIVGQPTGTALVPGSTAIPAGDATNTVTPPLSGTTLTTPNGTNNTSVGLPNSSVGIGQQSTTALGQPGTGAIGRQNTTAPGQQNTTALGQQGTVGIGQQSTTALGQQGIGTAITPQTNGFVVNADGSVVGIPSPVGGSAEAGLGGTNSGSSFGTNGFATNQFNRRTSQTNRFNSAP